MEGNHCYPPDRDVRDRRPDASGHRVRPRPRLHGHRRLRLPRHGVLRPWPAPTCSPTTAPAASSPSIQRRTAIASPSRSATAATSISSFGEDAAGELYVTTPRRRRVAGRRDRGSVALGPVRAADRLRCRAGRPSRGRCRAFRSPSAAAAAVISPDPASADNAAAAMLGGSISNHDRSASRVSLRPKPSVPSVTNGASIHGRTRSGSAFIQSVAATIGPPFGPRTVATYGVARPSRPGGAGSSDRPPARRGGASGTTAPSRPPRRRRTARRGAPARRCTWSRIEPEPTRRTRRRRLRAVPARDLRRRGEAVDAAQDALVDALGLGRLRVVLVVDRDVVDEVLGLDVHPLDAVADDRGELVGEGRVVLANGGVRHRQHVAVAVVVLEALAGEGRPARGRGHEEPARPASPAAQNWSPVRWKPNIE